MFADAGTEGQWIYLDFFSAEDGARHFARRACPACEGGGLVEITPKLPHGGDTDTCRCVRRLPA
ncbi:hypothetical protein ACIA5G_39980 [Amycolatopsis sp. NPDC051758]|uniref:hypothetical protein n=1 Tax=Amycolatopsis sp. NPDC051758 TaxID=3363935 RepID=UPI0037980003